MPDRAHICIIGAGIAGLTAAITIGEGADRLVQQGRLHARPDMTILESTSWLGGRARTLKLSNGIAVDAGPHWFHGGRTNPLYRWACTQHFPMGRVSVDTATNRVNISSNAAMSADTREWALNRLFELYAVWKAQHPDEDISLRALAEHARDPSILAVAEERANNWMAVDRAQLVSADEYWGDDASSGGMQLEQGVQSLVDAMVGRAEFYQADIRTRHAVRRVTTGESGFDVVTDKKTWTADYVVNTASIGVLKSGAMVFDRNAQTQLDQALAGLVVARSTKIFIPLREDFFTTRNIAPDTFVTFYDRNHAWLLHLRTDGKPIATIFASGAMSALVESMAQADMEADMLGLLERLDLTKGASLALDGRLLRTSWISDDAFQCAYSAVMPGHKRRNPLVCGNLIFAGEAFVQDLKKSPGQMTGAWESGRVAGRKILRKLIAS